ncbi:unnamed protein product, partial [Laminaria digitata]
MYHIIPSGTYRYRAAQASNPPCLPPPSPRPNKYLMFIRSRERVKTNPEMKLNSTRPRLSRRKNNLGQRRTEGGGRTQGVPWARMPRQECVTWMSRPMRKLFFLAGKSGSSTFLGVDFTCLFTCFFATP